MHTPTWSQGYVTDTEYADTFFRELSPTWLNYVAALSGVTPHNLAQPFTYLELGCGFGGSIIVNAGAFPHGEFYACDFNPAHIDIAERNATAYGISNLRFYRESFQALLTLELPQFDFIVLHGIYSWVDATARKAIRDIISSKLKPNGLVYISYNCLPGWSVELPLRKLLVELASPIASPIVDSVVDPAISNTSQRAQQALQSLTQLSNSGLNYFKSNPAAMAAVASYTRGSINYISHEFLNKSWEPFYSIDIAAEMSDIDLSYLGSATLASNHQQLITDEATAEVIANLPTIRQRQLAIDFATNQRFRRDVFVKSSIRLSPTEIIQHLNDTILGFLGNPAKLSTKAKVPRGEITFQVDFIRELAAILQQGSAPIGNLVVALAKSGKGTAEITRNLVYLVAAGVLMPFARLHSPQTSSSGAVNAAPISTPLLQRVLNHALAHRTHCIVPSEILGNGIRIQHIEALAINIYLQGINKADVLATRLEADIGDNTNHSATTQCASTATYVIDDLVPSLVRVGLMI